ncbi:MAG: FkbM family methyltransferase [Phycisphaerales bacterium]
MAYVLILLLAIALVVVALGADKRHKRLRRRLARAERREMELLHTIKPMYVDRARRRLADAGREPRMPVEFRSQFGEDLFLDELFDSQGDGFFIEVGAYDGYTYAVTYALESQGWSGLLVEPVPSLHAKAQARRPGSRVVNAALSRKGSTGTARFTHILGSGGDDYDASSYLDEPDSRGFSKRPPAKTNVEHVEVPLTTMTDLLAEHSGSVDLVVIDVEGGEMNLLDGFDLARFRPRVILIEDHNLGRDPAILNHLAANAYEHVCWISYNRLLVHKDEPALLERARRIAQHTATAKTAG